MKLYACSPRVWQVTVRDATSDKVTGKQPVKTGKPYKFQVWLVGPVAAADKAAGEHYKVWKVRGLCAHPPFTMDCLALLDG